MKTVAIYARVSSEKQAQQATIESQIEALKRRVHEDDHVLSPEHVYIDDGVSGTLLVRPALERLRDRAAFGGIDILYVHSPDRLARKYAYQVLLLEELKSRGVVVVFLQGATGDRPEDQLLVQVQGMIAEYERTKIIERSRRGKLFRARQGEVSAFGRAPYGYVYIRKSADAPAQFQIALHQAKTVRWIFDALVRQQLPIQAIVRALNDQGTTPPGGGNAWRRSAVHRILRNPAYAGLAAYGRTAPDEREPRNRLFRAASSRYARKPCPAEDWVRIPVPAIVSQEVFDAAADQLRLNLQRSSRNARGQRYLLQSLTVCGICGHAYSGSTTTTGGRRWAYYRCLGTIANRWGGKRVCANTPVRVDMLEAHVWNAISDLVQHPERLVDEWSQRARRDGDTAELDADRVEAERALAAHKRTMSRLVDAYEAGAIDLGDLQRRTAAIKKRIASTERDLQVAKDRLNETVYLRAIVARLEDFGTAVRERLSTLTWAERQRLIRTLVARVEIGEDGAVIVYRILPLESDTPPADQPIVDCIPDSSAIERSRSWSAAAASLCRT